MRHLVLAIALGCALGAPAQAHPPSSNQEFVGSYDLADGRQLTVTERHNKLYAQLDDQPPFQLVASGDTVFTARSGATRIEFVQHSNGLVSAARVTSPAPPAPSRS